MVKKSDLKKLNSIMQEGNSFKNEKNYNRAVEKYLEAMHFVEEKVKDPDDRLDEIENIKTQIDQVYSVKIIDIIEATKIILKQNEFKKALKVFDEARRIADKIEDPDLRQNEIDEIKDWLNIINLDQEIYQAERLRKEGRYENSIKILKDTLDKAKEIYKENLNHEQIVKIKAALNQNYATEINLLIEQGNQLKVSGKSNEALEIFKDALEMTEKFFESDLKNTEVANLKSLINQIYSNNVKPIVEKGSSLLEQNNYNEANKEFNRALNIAEEMFDSEQKKMEIDRITSIASKALNPIYAERIKPIIDEAKKYTIKENYEQDITNVNKAIELFKKALKIAEEMTHSSQKELEIKNIKDLINKTCLTRINLLKDNYLRQIAQKNYEKAVNELYAAISMAKEMSIAEEENEELEALKNSVNKAYSSQIDEILKEGKALLEEKEYDEALEIFKRGLAITNKMYLTEDMEKEENKIKSLIYQAELKDLVGRGDLSDEQKKFERELEKLNKKMEYAKTIDDPERRYEEMNKIKLSIDEVHHSEIKLLVEQAIQLSEEQNYNESFEYFEKAMSVNDLIESSEYKDKVPIKTKYKNELINKAKIAIKNKRYDDAINDCNDALKLDSAYIEAYFTIGIANTLKGDFDKAINTFKKALDLSKNHAKSWNHMGIAYEKKNEPDAAIESYQKAAEVEPLYAEAFYNMANAYRTKKDYEMAINNYRKATELDPFLAHAWLFMGYTYLDKKDYFTAVLNFDKAFEVSPDLINEFGAYVKDLKDTIAKLENKLSEKFEHRY
ncbi:MAG: tetratricopeptide repeat protein [Candidatus Thorarchaeota archaeon]